jgi:HK97 family phage prohead protease
MRVQIRNDSVVIDGYVNVVERESKRLTSPIGHFIEKIKQGAFKKSLARRSTVDVLLNHDSSRKLASTANGTATLREDAVGLFCRAEITDAEVIEKARDGKLSGWSFGFVPLSDKVTKGEDVEMRDVYDLDLREVSILDDRKNPAYPATYINTRDDEEMQVRYEESEVETNDVSDPVDGVTDNGEEPETGDPVNNRNYQYKNRVARARTQRK